MDDKKKLALRAGTSVIVLLLFMTAAEYLIGAYVKIWWGAVILLIIAVIKAFFVVRDYMHVSRVFNAEEEAHS